jgi:tRNA nucleotidyltransferase (CCA-adding enzyme)
MVGHHLAKVEIGVRFPVSAQEYHLIGFMKNINGQIPPEIQKIVETLQNKGFEAYLVGGCVRDIFRGMKPKDWDITTNAKPEQIQANFSKTVYENKYGTVAIINENVSDETLKVVEVTPYRLEAQYSDYRHPDRVSFSNNLEDDLKRRDFTMNAIAYEPRAEKIVDPYGGQEDIKDKLLRAVGNPVERFEEDALRMLRAVRFSCELGFTIEHHTMEDIHKSSYLLKNVSEERIRDEFQKIIMSENPMGGVIIAEKLGILEFIIPELREGIGCEQNGDHIYDVWEHSLRALNHAAEKNFPLEVRLAALLHDVGKPRTRVWSDENDDWTFYGHDVVGGKLAEKILKRLKFPRETIEIVTKLVRYHLFFSDVEKITLSAVRRIVRNVSPDHVWELMNVRACDRIGMGRPKETPYRLRKYEAMIEEAMRAPISVGMLKIDGAKLMEITGEKPGPRIGWILHALLEEALDDPAINTIEYLEKRAKELAKLPPEELKRLGEAGKEKKEGIEEAEIAKIRERHWVK